MIGIVPLRPWRSVGVCRVHNDHVDVELDQVSREPGDPGPHPFRMPLFDGDVLSFDIAQGLQALAERLELAWLGRGDPQVSDPRHLRQLRFASDRRHEESQDEDRSKMEQG